MEISPYVMFAGQCREAFTTYQKVLGGELQLMTYGDGPPAEGPAQPPDHVMHARLEAHGAVLMASDGPGGDAGKDNVWISLTLDDVAEAERVYGALAEGGHVVDAHRRDILGAAVRDAEGPFRRVVDGRT